MDFREVYFQWKLSCCIRASVYNVCVNNSESASKKNANIQVAATYTGKIVFFFVLINTGPAFGNCPVSFCRIAIYIYIYIYKYIYIYTYINIYIYTCIYKGIVLFHCFAAFAFVHKKMLLN